MAKLKASTNTTDLADVIAMVLDKGIVIDLWAKILIVGTEILRLEARVVVASVETYLKYAEAIGTTTRLVTSPARAAIAAPGLEIGVPAGRDIAVHAVP